MPNLTCCKFVALEEITVTFPKVITVIRPSTLLKVFFMGNQDLQQKEGLGRALNLPGKNWVLPLSFMPHPIPPLIADQILEK